jgi:hypothetical protein
MGYKNATSKLGFSFHTKLGFTIQSFSTVPVGKRGERLCASLAVHWGLNPNCASWKQSMQSQSLGDFLVLCCVVLGVKKMMRGKSVLCH